MFELLTATFAVDNFNLRDDWAERDARLKKHRALVSLENTDFLQAITLLVTQARRNAASAQGVAADQLPAISCKRKDALKVTTEDYKTWAGLIEKGLVRAAKFLTSQRIFDEKLDIHHISPRDWCDHESRRIPAAKRDTIINKTAISARTNRSIGGRAPSEYLQRLRNSAGCDETRQRQILETHLIDYEALSSDDFDRFLAAREDALVRLIEAATGRPVARSGAQSVNAMDEEPTEEETEE